MERSIAVGANPAYDMANPDIPPARRRSLLLPVAVIGAVTAVITVAALLAMRLDGQSQPRYVVTISQDVPQAEAVVRESAGGKITGQVAIPFTPRQAVSQITAAADDRSFIIGAYQDGPKGSLDLHLFLLRITASGRPGPLTELPAMALRAPPTVEGIALSPDGELLALSLRFQVPLAPDPLHYGGLEDNQPGYPNAQGLDLARVGLLAGPAVLGRRGPPGRVRLVARHRHHRTHRAGWYPGTRHHRTRQRPAGFPARAVIDDYS
jgi:hypothetical protein